MQTVWQISFWVMLVGSIICVPLQHRALNKIAFGRSVFITYTAIVMGYIIGVLATTVAADVMGILLYLLGMVMLVFMAVRSAERLREQRQRQQHNTD